MARKLKSATTYNPTSQKRETANAKRANRRNPREDRNVVQLFEDDDQRQLGGGFRLPRPKKRVNIIPRSLNQEALVDALYNPDTNIVVACGPAGVGKTYLATLYAIEQLLCGNAKKIVITRPMVEIPGENSIGALPGNLVMKVAPWAAAVLDTFKEYFDIPTLNKLMEEEIIELVPVSMLRGRSFKDCVIIYDECQNLTSSNTMDGAGSMLAAVTRIGENSKIILCGDPKQYDRVKSGQTNGLTDFVQRMAKTPSSRVEIIEFETTDIERHPVIFDILKAYGHTE